ncbi:MAG: heme-binding protein [Gammaproteobacteria bacterium]|nr:heme-binding protein [Gammaproteobacteria bacterium]
MPCIRLLDFRPSSIAIPLSLTLMSLLSGCSVFGVRSVEEAGYQVLQQEGAFELRRYEPMVIAETIVDTGFDKAGGIAFRRLFGYISGDNEATAAIAMTAPVMALHQGESTATRIEMTAPVTSQQTSAGWRFAFVLPSAFTLENAPLPTDVQVRLAALPARRVAVLRYSGLLRETSFGDNLARLRDWLGEKELAERSPPRVAGYDPPWTLPFLRRNEVMIDVGP